MQTSPIRYRVELADLERHLFAVECTIDEPAGNQVFRMPSWIPGSYLLREFARFVVSIDAEDARGPVAVEKIDKSAWRVSSAVGPVCVRILVHARDLSVRGAFIDRRRAFFNGTSIFLFPEGLQDVPIEVELALPAHGECADWEVATAMRAQSVDSRGFGVYSAENYDELIDHPVEVSAFERRSFDVSGVPHELVVAGGFDGDLERLVGDLGRICAVQMAFFGGSAPFEGYLFLCLAVGEGYGGLEHRASTSLIFNRTDLPKAGEKGVPKSYQRLLALCSHEYFHSWHVKQTKPAAFSPYRLDRRNFTRQLWVFEGITTYYQERFLLASGVISAEIYLQRLAEALTRVYRVPGRHRQSLSESSFDAWDSLYKPGPDSVNTGVSYYSKGALIALALDLLLRAESHGEQSLDDIVVALWQRYGRQGIGVPEDGFESVAVELGGPALADFFERAIRGTEDLDLESLFVPLGLRFALRPAVGPSDTGGVRDGKAAMNIGAVIRARDTGVGLEVVFDGSAAANAGLSAGDTVVAIDGFVVGENSLSSRLSRYEPGQTVRVDYIHDGLLLHTELSFQTPLANTCQVSIQEAASTAQMQLRKGWLGDA